MTDRNTQPYSEEFYREIEEEVKKLIKRNSEISATDMELIRAHIKCLEGAFHQYIGQIEGVLDRIESRNHREILNE